MWGILLTGLWLREDEEPRMVRTPWFDYEVPFEEAAEIGTRKVITDHSTIGIVITTDGSISDIPGKIMFLLKRELSMNLRNSTSLYRSLEFDPSV